MTEKTITYEYDKDGKLMKKTEVIREMQDRQEFIPWPYPAYPSTPCPPNDVWYKVTCDTNDVNNPMHPLWGRTY